jgi:hypothetical protein
MKFITLTDRYSKTKILIATSEICSIAELIEIVEITPPKYAQIETCSCFKTKTKSVRLSDAVYANKCVGSCVTLTSGTYNNVDETAEQVEKLLNEKV